MPPAIGPTQKIQWLDQLYEAPAKAPATAGPKARAGFIAAPVSGPIARISAATVSPMPKPPILGARGSTAGPQTAVTRKKVATISAKQPPMAVTGGNLRSICG